MALPSQTARVSASRSPMFRRKRTSPRPFLIAGGALVTVIAIGVAWSMGGARPVDNPTPPPLSSTDRIANAAGAARPMPPATPPRVEPKREEPKKAAPPPPVVEHEHQPVVINQGLASRTTGTKLETPATPAGPAPELKLEPKNEPRVEPNPIKPPEPGPASPASPGGAAPALTNAPAPTNAAPAAATNIGVSHLPADVQNLVLSGRQKAQARELVPARQLLSRALADPQTPESERALLRDELAKISDELVFSPRAAADDPYVAMYAVQSGDGLERIAKRNGVLTHWRLIQRVNQLANPNKVRLNQKLKLVKGPFHAIVSKSAFRMDVYMGPPDAPTEWLYIRSFRAGLGEGGGTPLGEFVVRKGSKLENPYWTNPRTGEQFGKDDPKNPIGERWIGIEGVGDSSVHHSLGIHGTIDPDSIGQEKSMGCIRLGAQDVELVYDMLGEGVSRVRIAP